MQNVARSCASSESRTESSQGSTSGANRRRFQVRIYTDDPQILRLSKGSDQPTVSLSHLIYDLYQFSLKIIIRIVAGSEIEIEREMGIILCIEM